MICIEFENYSACFPPQVNIKTDLLGEKISLKMKMYVHSFSSPHPFESFVMPSLIAYSVLVQNVKVQMYCTFTKHTDTLLRVLKLSFPSTKKFKAKRI